MRAGAPGAAAKVRTVAPGLAPRLAKGLAAGVAAGALAVLVTAAPASAKPAAGEMPMVALGQLPAEARTTYELIHAGGPFPFQKDGTVFMNRERLLPQQARGFYREYTVKTPRSRDRGARRIVCGGKPPTAPEACYYTADHYASFSRIAKP
jgi:ribonuclease T1